MSLPRVILLLTSMACFAAAFAALRPAQPREWAARDARHASQAQAPARHDATGPDGSPPDAPQNEPPAYSTRFISDGTTRLVHAASLAQQDDQVLAVWFAGSREGAGDISLHMDQQTLGSNIWGKDWVALTRQQTEKDQSRRIRKLGNAVLTPHADGSLSMFYVSVSLGGWATSAINHAVSYDGGREFRRSRRLVSSPLFNLSSLVKGAPLHYRDGTIALPTYHEMAGKFGELMHVTPDGTVLDKSRITSGRHSLQPVLLASDSGTTALLRHCGKETPRRVVAAHSRDAGHTWRAAGPTALPNPNSALSGLVLAAGELLLALNDTEQRRDRLGLVVSKDMGRSFKVIHYVEDMAAENEAPAPETFARALLASLVRQGFSTVEAETAVARAVEVMCKKPGGTCKFQFDYPCLIQTSDGNFHLAYTWNKCFIKHVTFNRAWLEQRL